MQDKTFGRQLEGSALPNAVRKGEAGLDAKTDLYFTVDDNVVYHPPSANPNRLSQSHEIHRAGQRVQYTKRQHRYDVATCVLQSPTILGHLVLLRSSQGQIVLVARFVNFTLKFSRGESPLWTDHPQKRLSTLFLVFAVLRSCI